MNNGADKPLSPKHLKYVQYVVEGNSASEAARRAGYSRSYARQAAYKLSQRPNIAAAIDKAREDLREKTGTTLESLMAEIDDGLRLAKDEKKPQGNAIAQLLRLKADVLGLIVNKNLNMDVPVNLADALAAAKARAAPGDDARIVDVDAAPALQDARARLVENFPDPAGLFND